MRKLVLFVVLGSLIGAAAVWHFSRETQGEEALPAAAPNGQDWDPEVLRDARGKIVVGGGPPPPEPVPSQAQAVPSPKAELKKEAAAPAPKPAGDETYTVRAGDTLGEIAKRKYGSAAARYVDAIAKRNGLKDPDTLRVGAVLTLPDPASLTPAR